MLIGLRQQVALLCCTFKVMGSRLNGMFAVLNIE